MTQEQRRYGRVPLPVVMRCRVTGTSAWLDATAIDFSATGMRVRTTQPLEPGAHLELQLELPIRREPYAFQAEVMRAGGAGEAALECGLAFVGVSIERRIELDMLVGFVAQRRPE